MDLYKPSCLCVRGQRVTHTRAFVRRHNEPTDSCMPLKTEPRAAHHCTLFSVFIMRAAFKDYSEGKPFCSPSFLSIFSIWVSTHSWPAGVCAIHFSLSLLLELNSMNIYRHAILIEKTCYIQYIHIHKRSATCIWVDKASFGLFFMVWTMPLSYN